MFKIEIDLVNQCGECNDFHYTVYKWTGNAWVNILCGIRILNMKKNQIRNWFSNRNYKIEFDALEPVFRKQKIYAVASPRNGGGWCSFLNINDILKYISEQDKISIL